MGNLCSSEREPFSQPGRPLGSTPAAPTSASVPASAKAPRKVGGPPRTLGGGGGEAGPASSSAAGDARAKAAAAAEVCYAPFSSIHPISTPSHFISYHLSLPPYQSIHPPTHPTNLHKPQRYCCHPPPRRASNNAKRAPASCKPRWTSGAA
jgi:hypothetical protein